DVGLGARQRTGSSRTGPGQQAVVLQPLHAAAGSAGRRARGSIGSTGRRAMTDLEQRTGDAFHDAVVASGPGPGKQKWWLEIPLAIAFYIAYARIRDWHGGGAAHQRGLARRHGYD